MQLTPLQTLGIIFAVALGAAITRFAPFLLFPQQKTPPQFISDLGKLLPAAMMGLLVVYCLKNLSFAAAPHGLPELISIGAIVVLHSWKRNVLLSIGGGTLLFMLLSQWVFV